MRTRTIWITSTFITVGLIAAGTAAVLATSAAAGIGGAALAVPGTPSASPDSIRSASPDPSASASPDPSASAPAGSAQGDDIERAIAAALAASGPGTVIDADRDDDPGHAYEIDVRRDSGGVVEVKLDASLNVVSTEADDRGGDDGDRSGGDDSGHGSDDD